MHIGAKFLAVLSPIPCQGHRPRILCQSLKCTYRLRHEKVKTHLHERRGSVVVICLRFQASSFIIIEGTFLYVSLSKTLYPLLITVQPTKYPNIIENC